MLCLTQYSSILKARLARQLELIQEPSQCTEEVLAAMVLPGEGSFEQVASVSRVLCY